MADRATVPIRWTTLGRPIDLGYPTNRAIAVLAAFVFVSRLGVGLAHGDGAWSALLLALQTAGAVFLAWALGRETDPDRPVSAFFAAAGALTSTILLGPPHFLLIFWFLLSLRIVNRSTGLPPGALDFGAFYGIKLWLGAAAHWTVPLLTLPTMLFAGLRRFPVAVRIALPLVLPCAGVAFGFLHRWHLEPIDARQAGPELAAIAVTTFGVAFVIHSYRVVRSAADRTGEPLEPHRVQWALAWAAGAGLALTLGTQASLQDLGPLWAALAGSVIGWAIETIAGRRSKKARQAARKRSG